jgi:hypothetical protein
VGEPRPDSRGGVRGKVYADFKPAHLIPTSMDGKKGQAIPVLYSRRGFTCSLLTCNGLRVSAGPLDQFGFSTPASTVAGQPFSMVLSATDAYGNVLTDYTGTVRFSGSDSHP